MAAAPVHLVRADVDEETWGVLGLLRRTEQPPGAFHVHTLEVSRADERRLWKKTQEGRNAVE